MRQSRAGSAAVFSAWVSLLAPNAVAQTAASAPQVPPAPQTASAAHPADAWQFQASIYIYLPSIGGTTRFPLEPGAGGGISVDVNSIVENLKMAFLGSFEARKGRWGGFTDVLYMDLGNSGTMTRGLTVNDVPLPVGASANASFDLKATLWTLAGSYRAVDSPAGNLDLLTGARLMSFTESFNWQLSGNVGSIPLPSRAGTSKASSNDWDGIIGIKGRAAFGADRKWLAPYYLDVGTGASKLTWQAMGGVGYVYSWGDLLVAWRYVGYTKKEGEPLQSLNLNGPLIAATFRW